MLSLWRNIKTVTAFLLKRRSFYQIYDFTDPEAPDAILFMDWNVWLRLRFPEAN